MTTRLYTHPIFLEHITPPGHPERPDRLRAIERVLDDEAFAALDRARRRRATRRTILYAHPAISSRACRAAIPEEGHRPRRCRHHRQPEELAGGAHRDRRRQRRRRRCLFRRVPTMSSSPPGRPATMPKRPPPWAFASSTRRRSPHATRRRSMAPSASPSSTGTSITATARRTFSGTIRRCSIARRTRCRFIPAPAPRTRPAPATSSTRRWRPQTGSDVFREAFLSRVLPALDNFAPDLIIISAGFDAHHRDPLAEINLTEDDFDWATGQLMERAARHSRQPARQPARRRLRSAGTGIFGRRPCRAPDERMNDGLLRPTKTSRR